MTSLIPDPQRPPNPYHVHEHEVEELLALLAPGFETVHSEVKDCRGVDIVRFVGKSRGCARSA